MHSVDIEALNQQIYIDSAFIEKLNEVTSGIIVGQEKMMERLLLGLLTRGHVLLEGLPGLAKTLAIKTLSTAVDAKFSRINLHPICCLQIFWVP
ncbi:MAG: AAA family ATPase [Saprospiraceae bacterium]